MSIAFGSDRLVSSARRAIHVHSISSKCDGSVNILGMETGKVSQNLFGRVTGSQTRKNRAQGDAGAFENRFATTKVRIANNSLFVQFIIVALAGHGLASHSQIITFLEHLRDGKPRMLREKVFGAAAVRLQQRCKSYLGVTSRASLLITTSRRSLRFFPASIIASREP